MDQTQENQEGQIIPPDRVQKLVEKIKIYILVKQLKEDGDPIEIIPHLYIGCMGAALNKKKLKEANIVRVLSVCEMPNTDKVEFNWLTINVQDSPNQNITHKFDDSNDFIHEGIQSQQNVLVHCFAGKSRSTSFIMAYLIKYHQMNVADALQTVKDKRPIAQPNEGFLIQLESYYKQLYK